GRRERRRIRGGRPAPGRAVRTVRRRSEDPRSGQADLPGEAGGTAASVTPARRVGRTGGRAGRRRQGANGGSSRDAGRGYAGEQRATAVEESPAARPRWDRRSR